MFTIPDQKFQQSKTSVLLSKSLSKIAALIVTSLFLQTPAHAQDIPPGRVARVSYVSGNISFVDAGSDTWTSLQPNRPISTGDSLQVPYAGRAELHVGSNAIRMQDNTRMSFTLLDDDNTQIDMAQGSMLLKIRSLTTRENFDIRTPNLVFSLQEPGEYRININDDNTTTVMVRRGTAIARGERDTITIRQGEQSRFAGANLQHTLIGSVPPFDTFDLWAADRDRAEENVETARYVSREVIGYEQLDNFGVWETHTDYGPVWYPSQVSATWAPYRDGNWVWVAPWGWTWVDSAPWGFAPYHYGRWAYIGTRWAWVPGSYQQYIRPVYAPALVAFVGDGQYFASISTGGRYRSQPCVAWFPLGPGEAYRPGYTTNQYYIQRLNQNIVINNIVVNNNYINQNNHRAWTVVPTQTFVRGEHIVPATNSKFVIPASQTPAIATVAPNIAPSNNIRFGVARQNNWNNGEQFRQRNLVIAPAHNETTGSISNPGNSLTVNRPAMNGFQNMPQNGAQSSLVIRPPSNVATPPAPNSANLNAPANNAIVNVPVYRNPGNNVQNNFSNANNANSPRPPNPGAQPPATQAVNNAIMSPPIYRPAENVDHSQRNSNNGTWNNHGQPELHVDRPAERPPERIQLAPAAERPAQMQPTPQQVRIEPHPVQVQTQQPPVHIESRPAPMPSAAPMRAPAPTPAPQQERAREKEDAHNAKQHILNER